MCGLREGERRQRAVRSQEEVGGGGGGGYAENYKNMNDVYMAWRRYAGFGLAKVGLADYF